MTSEPRDRPPRLPLRRLILMPWRWRRWALWAIGICVSLFPVAYFLSAVPLIFIWIRIAGTSPETDAWFAVVYGPAIFVRDSSELAQAVIEWEVEGCESIFGPFPP